MSGRFPDGRAVPEAVQWHEGMLLAPQHFQESDRRVAGLLHYHLAHGVPHYWGVQRLEVDPVLLANGTFRVTELEAVMPDGLLVDEGEDALEVDLTEHVAGVAETTLTVHLAVPVRRDPREAVAGELARYGPADAAPVPDPTAPGEAVMIPRLRPRPRLLVGDTPPEKYTSFPLARVVVGEESFGATDFVPPHLTLGARRDLRTEVGTVVKSARERAAFLAQLIRGAPESSVSPSDVRRHQRALEILVAGLPAVEAVLQSRHLHPVQLHQALCVYAGMASGLVQGTVPPLFPPYDHDDLRATFAPVLSFVRRMVDSVQLQHRALPFQRTAQGFQVEFPELPERQTVVVGVRGGDALDEDGARSWFDEAVVGSASRVKTLLERRIRGATREPVAGDPELGLVPRPGVVLFQVGLDPDVVVAGEPLQVLHPGERRGVTRPAELILYVKP